MNNKQIYKIKYNLLVNNLANAVNDKLIDEEVMHYTLQFVNTSSEQKVVDWILNTNGEEVIKSCSKEVK
jgi:hypothetical protein